jgi:hypothetical protein
MWTSLDRDINYYSEDYHLKEISKLKEANLRGYRMYFTVYIFEILGFFTISKLPLTNYYSTHKLLFVTMTPHRHHASNTGFREGLEKIDPSQGHGNSMDQMFVQALKELLKEMEDTTYTVSPQMFVHMLKQR